jgi:hypothetical protein
MLLSIHLFDCIIKPDVEIDELWQRVNRDKLFVTVQQLMPVFSKYFNQRHRDKMKAVFKSTLEETSDKHDVMNSDAYNIDEKIDPAKEFPCLHRFGIPLVFYET